MDSDILIRNKKFYSNFFKKKNFLTPRNNFYSSKYYLESLGFSKNLFINKVVLEVGAGSGRLFFCLSKHSYLKKVKKYIILEPSDGIDYIKKNCKIKNIVFQKKAFQDLLNDKSLNNKIDLLLLSGVVPHISDNFEKILKLSKTLLKKNGKVQVNFSYYGISKSIDYKIKKNNLQNFFLISILSFLKTILSYLLSEKIFKTFFVFSMEKNFQKRFYQFKEFYSVIPYKIFFNYKYCIDKINNSNYKILKFFSNSFSVLIQNTQNPKKFTLSMPPQKNTIVFGNDWITKLFIDKYKYSKSTTDINYAVKYDNIILAYDCYKPNVYSFYEILNKIPKKKKFELGKNMFIYQMFGNVR
jgi:hypothetical protein